MSWGNAKIMSKPRSSLDKSKQRRDVLRVSPEFDTLDGSRHLIPSIQQTAVAVELKRRRPNSSVPVHTRRSFRLASTATRNVPPAHGELERAPFGRHTFGPFESVHRRSKV